MTIGRYFLSHRLPKIAILAAEANTLDAITGLSWDAEQIMYLSLATKSLLRLPHSTPSRPSPMDPYNRIEQVILFITLSLTDLTRIRLSRSSAEAAHNFFAMSIASRLRIWRDEVDLLLDGLRPILHSAFVAMVYVVTTSTDGPATDERVGPSGLVRLMKVREAGLRCSSVRADC